MSSLFAERNTAFLHSLWDRFEFTAFLNGSRKLKDQDFKDRQAYQYSVVQDSYYALLGRPTLPNLGNSAVTLWEHTLEADWFGQLQKLFRQDKIGKRLAVSTLADIYALRIKNENDKADADDAETQERRKQLQDILDQLQQCKQNPQASEDGDKQEEPDQDGQADANQEGDDADESDGQAQAQGGSEESGNDSQSQQDARNNGQPSQAQAGVGQTGTQGQPTEQPAQDVPSVGENVPYQDIGPAGGYKADENYMDETMVDALRMTERAEDKHQSLSALLPFVHGKGEEQLDNAESLLSSLDATAIAKFLGFAMRAVRGAHRLTDSTVGELTRYKNVVWSEKLHPVDMVGIANGDPRTQVRMAEGSLRERRFEDKNPKGRGPVIVLRDETGSMNDYGSKQKHHHAQALEVALAHAFNADRRDLVSIAWGDVRTRMCVYGEDNVQAHLSTFIDGGDTEIKPALTLGIQKATEYVDGADILVITDGVIRDSLLPDLKPMAEKFRQTNGRIWVVLVGNPFQMTNYLKQKTLEECLPWADGVIHLDHISDDKALGDLLTRMNRKELSLKGKKVAV